MVSTQEKNWHEKGQPQQNKLTSRSHHNYSSTALDTALHWNYCDELEQATIATTYKYSNNNNNK